MKIKLSITFLFLFTIAVWSQDSKLISPSPVGLEVNSDKYQDHVDAYNNYWIGKDHTVRGSGYKQLQRWMELWKHEIKPDGTLPTAWELAQSWNNIMNLKFAANEMDDDSDWMPLGPFTHTNQGSWSAGQGRVNVSLVDPNNPNKLYVGTPDGGLWVSDDHGESWTALTLYLPSIGVSGIAVDYNNSNIIYITTGDEDAGDSYSIGVYKSTDGGVSWNPTGATVTGNNALMGEIYMHPGNSNVLWAVSSQGLFKTSDAGANWVRTFTGNVKEIRLKPGDPNTVYIVEQKSSPSSVYIHKSTDGGVNFTEIKSYASASRTVIDVTAANPDYLYVLVSNLNYTFKTLDRSTDSGASFQIRNNTTDIFDGSQQSWFDLALAVSDTDPELLFTGTLNVWKSTNGGTNLTRGAEWSDPDAPNYTHADIHDLKFFNGSLYAGTDGGIYISADNGVTFSDKTKNGLNIGQFYRIDVAPETSSKIVGGLQDNGGYAYINNDWKNFYGADGMDAGINPANSNMYYGFIQNGMYLYRFNAGNPGGDGQYVTAGPSGGGNWITPLEFSSSGIMYAGYSKLYRLSGSTFQDSSTNTFSPRLDYIRVDPTDDKRLLVGTYQKIFISEGQTAYPLTFTQLPNPTGGWKGNITNTDFNQDNPSIIYVTSVGAVFKSTDSGQTWENITYNLPVGQTKYVVAHQKGSPNNTVYVGTRNAVWYIDDTMSEWQLFNNNLPNARITDLEINTVEGHVIVSTYGRGVWRSPVTESSLGVNDVSSVKEQSMIYPNPIVNGKAKLNTLIDEPAVMIVQNMAGKSVKNQSFNMIDNKTDLDFSNLPKGVYVVTIKSERHLIRKKVIIR